MKTETQSLNLRKMMEKQRIYPQYDLALDSVCIKKKSLSNLEVGSVLLLGVSYLNMVLVQNGNVCAKVKLANIGDCSKIEIISIEEPIANTNDSKKYEQILCSLGKINCKKIELGHKVGISSLGIKEIEIFVDNNIFAKGSLVSVDDEIAIQINEVNNA